MSSFDGLGQYIQGVLFDMDGTIVNSEPVTVEAINRFATHTLGKTISSEFSEYCVGRGWNEIHAKMSEAFLT